MRKLMLWCWLALIWMPVGCVVEEDPDDFGPPDDDFAADDDTGDSAEGDEAGSARAVYPSADSSRPSA